MEPRVQPKILVIDDDPRLSELCCTYLNREYSTTSCNDPERAFQTALQETPDLILCDVVMPKLSGAELLHRFRLDPNLQNVPVVMMTGVYLDPTTWSMFQQESNFHSWIRKPFTAEALMKTVGAALKDQGRKEEAGTATQQDTVKTSHKILVVEDEERFFQLLTLLMDPVDIAYRASDGRQALDMLRTLKPDLIVTDLLMPKMNGMELLAAMSQNPDLREIPIIITTGKTLTPEDIGQLKKDFPNIKHVLNKPFPNAVFQKALDSVLR